MRIGQVQHLPGGGNQAHDALADAQPRAAHGRRVEPVCGAQFQNFAAADAVGRAHFGDKLAGDDGHDVTERRLAGAHHGAQAR